MLGKCSFWTLVSHLCVCVCVVVYVNRYVVIAMEALDQLLMACHSQSIKPFVESFLHMVAKLLESREPDLQVLGTNSVSLCVCEWANLISAGDSGGRWKITAILPFFAMVLFPFYSLFQSLALPLSFSAFSIFRCIIPPLAFSYLFLVDLKCFIVKIQQHWIVWVFWTLYHLSNHKAMFLSSVS